MEGSFNINGSNINYVINKQFTAQKCKQKTTIRELLDILFI